MEQEKEKRNAREKVARLMATNNKKDLQDLKALLGKVIGNIISSPTEEKYRRLKASNNTIKKRLLDRKGGQEMLVGLGFVAQIDEADGEKYLVLPAEEEQASLEAALCWFNDTVESISQQAMNDSDPCAECIVNVKLPTGNQVQGGFLRHESILAVVSFIELYFNEEKKGKLVLRQPHDPTDLAGQTNADGEHPSLEALGMGKRAVLICSSLQDDARESVFAEKRSSLTETLESDQIKLRSKVRESVVASKDRKVALAEEKNSLVKQFHDDRNYFGKEEPH